MWIGRLSLGTLQEAGKPDEGIEVTQATYRGSDLAAGLRVVARGQVPDPL